MARQALIKLRRGTGAPADGTLAEGELAIDIAAKKLYTANSTGNTQVISGDQYNLAQSGNATHGVVTLTVDNSALSNDNITITGGTDITVAGNSTIINVNSTSTLATITGRGATTSTTIVGNGGFTGDLTGNVTGDVTGNADTATALETARNIQGVSFDGTADITTLTAGDGVSVSGTAAAVNPGAGIAANSTGTHVVAGTGVTSNATGVHIGQDVATTADVTFNTVTADLTGDVTGNVTGDVTGDLTGAVVGTTISASGAVDLNNTLNVAGVTTLESTTASSSTGTGALVVAGGAGVGGNLYVGGNLFVEGTTTQVSSTTVTIDDNLIKLAANQTGTDTDAVDTGVYSTFDVGDVQKYSGFVRDTSNSNKAFVFFEGITTEPTGTVSYSASELAYIEAIIDGGTY